MSGRKYSLFPFNVTASSSKNLTFYHCPFSLFLPHHPGTMPSISIPFQCFCLIFQEPRLLSLFLFNVPASSFGNLAFYHCCFSMSLLQLPGTRLSRTRPFQDFSFPTTVTFNSAEVSRFFLLYVINKPVGHDDQILQILRRFYFLDPRQC